VRRPPNTAYRSVCPLSCVIRWVPIRPGTTLHNELADWAQLEALLDTIVQPPGPVMANVRGWMCRKCSSTASHRRYRGMRNSQYHPRTVVAKEVGGLVTDGADSLSPTMTLRDFRERLLVLRSLKNFAERKWYPSREEAAKGRTRKGRRASCATVSLHSHESFTCGKTGREGLRARAST